MAVDLPKKFNDLYLLLNEKCAFKNILIVNTKTTGSFLDKMCLDKTPIRIKYNSNNLDELVKKLNGLSDKPERFDLILLDPYHEYNHSMVALRMLTALLDETGILISHDCYPPNFNLTSPVCTKGAWCGVTYAAFIENAYDNPNFYYAVINNDYGLGILSKLEIVFVKKIMENEKQTQFLEMFKQNDYENAYNYLKQYSNEIINLVG
jgi:hypothetical protein